MIVDDGTTSSWGESGCAGPAVAGFGRNAAELEVVPPGYLQCSPFVIHLEQLEDSASHRAFALAQAKHDRVLVPLECPFRVRQ